MERKTYRKIRSAQAAVFDIISALCRDYDRRNDAVKEERVSRRVRMEYMYINTRMMSAATEVAGAAMAEQFIREIGMGVGYAASKLDFISETAYKAMKQRIKVKIAKRLYLTD